MTARAGELLIGEIVPRITAVVARSVKLVGCEDAEEVTQDAIAMAAKMLDNVERAGKKVTPGNIAYYCLQHIKSGRRSVGNSVVDVLATGTQLHGKCVVESLSEIEPDNRNDDGGNFSLAEMVSRVGVSRPALSTAQPPLRGNSPANAGTGPQRHKNILRNQTNGVPAANTHGCGELLCCQPILMPRRRKVGRSRSSPS